MDVQIDRREQSLGKIWVTMAASAGATVISALLLYVASNQLQTATTLAVIQRDLQTQASLMIANNNLRQKENARLEEYLGQVWPRLRSLQQNQVIIARELEELCDCEIELKEPENF